jgi:uncharacterized protein YecE (DUF72 family)
MNKSGLFHIGTSGWHYQHWKGPFYPQDLPNERLLEHYLKHFRTAEINNTFYQLPARQTFVRWRDSVPEGFLFSVKASRYITHMKKLKDPDEPISTLIDSIRVLEDKLGPILFQLPPRWNANIERLNSFLTSLPDGYRYAFEFRDESWFGQETEETLRRRGAAFCIYDFEGRQSPRPVTGDFIYVRLHGPDGAYQGKYDNRTLTSWAEILSSWTDKGKEIFCYFDNDENGYAAQNALELQELLANE